MDKTYLENNINSGISLRKIALKSEVSLATVRYWVKKYEIKIERYSRELWDETKLRTAADGATSKREILHRLGFRDSGSIYNQLDKLAKKWNIELPIHDRKLAALKREINVPNKIFQYGSNSSGSTLKKYMISFYNISLKCAFCELTEWREKPLTLEVDHIDGNHRNNIIQNLRFLCPNCHSQTETYSRRN